LATSLVLVVALIVAPSSAWLARADTPLATTAWLLTGNAGINPGTNFLGTTDQHPLVIRTANLPRLVVLSNGNVGIGANDPSARLVVSGTLAVDGTTAFTGNVGIGSAPSNAALNAAGDINTSTRYDIGGTTVLQTPGGQNIFVGPSAGNPTTTGYEITAVGASALNANTTGTYNSASGGSALASNTTGSANTATGYSALTFNTTGFQNTATGQGALSLNTDGSDNTATGTSALALNTEGLANTATGYGALGANTTGWNNTAVGYFAGLSDTGNNSNTTGSYNTFIGSGAGLGTPTQLTNATAIGANAAVSESNALVLGSPGVNVGIGTQTPRSTLQVAGNGTGYGSYLQIPIVRSVSDPPASDCNSTTFAGRMVLQDNGGAITLWVCSASLGTWVAK
jgi:hypothetical protein